ncbi:hypothetical protein [Stieleria mannarensis]|uniref:hypothetical protein n=1 Tax=Stieleria mannarensis TaxID=2755585 RepID=UPI001602A36A|nr:hypothetical protein [Rhodopirellula sp. JC639]
MDDVSELLKNLTVCQSLVREAEETPAVKVRFQTPGFEIVADCDLGGRRISDVMNQSISDYMECRNASLYRHGRLIDQMAKVNVRKPEIMIAGIAGDTHEAAAKRIGSRRALQLFHTVVAIDRWIVKGRLHMTTHKSVKEFLHANRDFFPIADASVVDAETPDTPQHMNVAIVNRQRVSFMEITELEASDSDPSPVARLLHKAKT